MRNKDMTCLMVDIETTGTRPDRAAILQLAAVPFCLKTGKVAMANLGEVFNVSFEVPPTRVWENDTARWWGTRKEVLDKIRATAVHPYTAMKEFSDFLVQNFSEAGYFFTNRSFDWMFIEGYFKDCGVHNPVQYWQVRELNSTMMGATFPKMEHKFPKIIPKINVENMVYKEGVLSHVEDHNALFDCYKQIYKLFTVLKEYKQCQQFEIQS